MKSLGHVIEIRPERIRPFANQPRKFFDEPALKRLERSIHAAGQQNPIIVKPLPGNKAHDYELIDGQRRWHACKRLQIEIRAIVRDDIEDEDRQFAVSVVSNFAREDHTPMETARAIERMRRLPEIALLERVKQAEAIGAMFGHSQVWVYQYESLLRLAPELQLRIDPQHPNPLSFRVAAQLAAMPHDKQREVAKSAKGLGRDAAVSLARRVRTDEAARSGGSRLRDDKVLLTAMAKLEQLILDGGLNFTRAFATHADSRELAYHKIDQLIGELSDLREEIEATTQQSADNDLPGTAAKPAEVKQAPRNEPSNGKVTKPKPGAKIKWDATLGKMVCVDEQGQPVEAKAPGFKPMHDGLR